MKIPTPIKKRQRKSSAPALASGEHTIDELAQLSGSTVRNIRAYQDRGILDPPEKRGRVGIYTDSHTARLDIINNLLDRGYSIDNIKELLGAWQEGRAIDDIIGLERAITMAFSNEKPREYTVTELVKLFGLGSKSKEMIEQSIKLGLLERRGRKLLAPSPVIIDAGAQLVSLGMPFDEILTLLRMLRGNVQRAADGLVNIAVDRFDAFGDELPPQTTINELSELIWQIRPIASKVILAEAEQAITRSLHNFLGDRLSAVIEQLHKQDSSGTQQT